MCGRYDLSQTPRKIAALFRASLAAELDLEVRRWNIAPSQSVPVVRLDRTGGRELKPMRWGLVPMWAKDPAVGNRMINARAETVATNRAFKRLIESRRCLVPATGFYEWRKEGKARQPLRVCMAGERLFAFAGLWDRWRAADGTTLHSFTILTCPSNPLVAKIHDRMPVIVPEEEYETWLSADAAAGDMSDVLRPYPADEMDAYPVSRRVNSPKNDDPECVAPLADESNESGLF